MDIPKDLRKKMVSALDEYEYQITGFGSEEEHQNTVKKMAECIRVVLNGSETIEQHFNKILPRMGFDYYSDFCCRNLDSKINPPENCDGEESTCEQCWQRSFGLATMKE